MSREHVEVYLRNAEAWTRGDLDEWLEDLHPEWEFRSSGVFPGLASRYRGVEGARQLWQAMNGPWERLAIEVDRIEDLGDKVIALITFHGRGRDGIEKLRPWAHVVTFREGQAVLTENYPNWEEALEAVGLRE